MSGRPRGFLGRSWERLTRGEKRPRGLRMVGLGAGLAIGLGLVLVLIAVQITSSPHFCGTCHIMKPYYRSWETSKHHQIACVECHIPPGATAEVRKKYEALAMVAKYVTKTYGTRVWTEVDDAACLRCHERRLLDGREDFHGVIFDHTPHLTESRRGLKLRCTSCHSQIVQGNHIAVTVSTCALCHFQGQPLNAGMGKCTTCHAIPEKTVTVGATRFDHGMVARFGINCALCHTNAVKGDGAVPRQNCLTCHSEPERLAMYAKTDFLHRMHVSEHKVDCERCHLVIEHGRAPAPVAPVAGVCAQCHGGGHSPQFQLYAGIGGRGVPRMPSPMFAVGVSCEGCHSAALQPTTATTSFASPAVHAVRSNEVACMMCHGSAYGTIFESWKAGVGSRTAALGRQMDATAAALGRGRTSTWSDAQANFLLVRDGNGLHNVDFAYALLTKAHQQMNAARAEARLSTLPVPWSEVAGGQECLACHRGIESQSGTFAGRAFSHTPHLGAARLACQACHRPHAERAPGEVVRFAASGCTACHHSEKQAPVVAATCTTCHGNIRTKVFPSARGAFTHAPHLDNGVECATCHTMRRGDPRPDAAVCASCHEGG